ncbi:hypothetical protein SI65_08359 [Aspergillus cristatus]|uniref:HTH psq-type domain-containing protein n=1 Tax=Aspergillus cristatus TaxID=573508 RepID=A0A1E3B5Z2_ASPCR|nr:hypothetical protein SI65_08359 [Aspergillus cristatus]
MATNMRRESFEKEGRISLAIDAFKRGQSESIRAAASAFDISHATLGKRLKGRPPALIPLQMVENLVCWMKMV